MKVDDKYFDEIFDFAGQWDMPSKCGLKIIKKHLSNALDTNGINEFCNKYLNKETKNE